jgi:hypothetical protein
MSTHWWYLCCYVPCWHVYVLPPGYFVWPCSPHIHRTEFVTSHNEQKNKSYQVWCMCIVLQVWPISTLMPLESKRRQNTLNNTDLNVSCYCNSKLPKTYTWSVLSSLKMEGIRSFNFFFFSPLHNFVRFVTPLCSVCRLPQRCHNWNWRTRDTTKVTPA